MTTLGANVTLIEHSIVYDETLEDYTIQVDYAIPLIYRAAQVPKLGDSYPGDTAPWGYIVINHESFKMVRRQGGDLYERFDAKLIDTRGVALGPYVTRVTYAKPKVPFDSGIEGLKEVYRKPETGRRGRRMGTRIFLAVDNTVESVVEESLPELVPMAAAGEWAAALLREKAVERNWRIGLARIEARYDSYADIGEIIHVNKGILEADASAVMLWNRAVVPGTTKRIDEIYVADGVRKQWVRIKGNNGWPLVKANFRIRALLTESNLAAIKGLVGLVNEGGCPNIVSAGSGTLWFNKFSMRQRQRGAGRLYDVIIGLAADPAGWDSETLAQLQKYRIIRQQLLDENEDAIAGQFLPTGSWVPDSDAAPTKMPLTENTASFAYINGLLT